MSRLALMLLIFPVNVLAVVCDNPQSSDLIRIYFVNGMNNSAHQIEKSTVALSDLVGETPSRTFGKSINNKEGFITQLLEVFEQRQLEVSKLWEWLQNLSDAPEWFKNTFNEKLALIANLAVYADLDLRLMVDEYLQDLHSGKKVLLVSHSQGNFYANNAYQFIRDNYPKYINSIGIVAVGTPSGRVQDGGHYTTNSLDLVINLVRLGYYVLPANMTYDEPGTLLNHSFIGTYLAAAGPKIRSDVFNTINRLVVPEKHFDCKTPDEVPVIVDTTYANYITQSSARLNGYVISGKNLYTWTNWKAGSFPISCSSNAV